MHRSDLGFAAEAAAQFHFLETSFGLVCVERGDTRVRWEAPSRFVDVFHGRQSFELGVHLGRWIEIRGERVEHWFSLNDFMVVLGVGSLESHGWAARERSLVARLLSELAIAAQRVAPEVLNNGDAVFENVSRMNAERSDAYLDDMHASRLRALAEDAWRRRDFQSVVYAYLEISQDLKTVVLTPSERGRLDYARRALLKEK
jgi:hypothetical protein